VQSIKATSPDSLALQLTAPYTTDLEKVRAIYSWICQNIRYNVDIYRPVALRARYVPEPIDTSSEWKPADEMYAQKVLRRGVAVCEGYSRLFKTLCVLAGVEAVVLNGYVRTNFDRAAERFRTNHTWNAVRIDSTWHLVDPTWGAGYVSYGDEFVQKQNDFYFLTPPQDMIRDHYPEDLRWTLLPQPPTLAEFRKMPFKSKSFVKYGIQAYLPSSGLLEAEVGDTLSFSISLRDVTRSKGTSPDPFFDTASFALSPNSVFIKPEKEGVDKVFYRFVVDETTQWVHLLFNDDVILRYNVSRRPSLASN
jgi:transglutaminase/protease-like cytokinesis protein 3